MIPLYECSGNQFSGYPGLEIGIGLTVNGMRNLTGDEIIKKLDCVCGCSAQQMC